MLGWSEVGFVYFFSNFKISSLDELRSTKVWMWEGDPLAKALFDAINISPIPLSIVDVMTSLQTGLIDTVYVSPLGAIALQWFTKVKYMLELPMVEATGAILITKKCYNKLSSDLQEILKYTFQNHATRLTQLTRKDNAESIEVMKEAGAELIPNTEAVVREFKDASMKARKILTGNLFPAELLEDIVAEIEGYRKK